MEYNQKEDLRQTLSELHTHRDHYTYIWRDAFKYVDPVRWRDELETIDDTKPTKDQVCIK